MYTVYKHTAPNGKVYIGITSQKPEYRWKNGNGYKKNKHFYRAILKYGWDNIKHEIICQSPMSAAQAGAVEKSFIKLYDSTNPDKGYNHSIGGDKGALGHKPSKSVRKAWSENHKGQVPWNKGRHMSIEARLKMSEKDKGRTPWNKGMTMPDEYRQKLSVAHKGQNPTRVKQVICIETLDRYASASEAARRIGLTTGAVTAVCRGINKTAGGYHWKYAENMEESK